MPYPLPTAERARACRKPILSGCDVSKKKCSAATERDSMTQAASSRGFRWIVRARSWAPAKAIAFFLTDLPTVNSNFTCHERVSVAPMRQTGPVSKLVSQYHAGTLYIC
jgi:hypothetical protein